MPPRLRYLRPNEKAEIHATALLPGDPARALALAQELIDGPLMTNHARGLWGYSGPTATGLGLTIQSTGIGAASAAVVVAELAEIGVKRAVRLGTCSALETTAALGEALVVEASPALDGVSRSGAPDGLATPDRALTEALAERKVGRKAVVAGADPICGHADSELRAALDAGAEAVDLQAAAVIASAAALGLEAACVSVVADAADGERLEGDALAQRTLEVGVAAARALERTPGRGSPQTLESR